MTLLESAVENVILDVRYAFRLLLRNLRFTAATVLALATGIGVNTAVLTAYKAMVARPLDARDPGRMVNLALTRSSGTTDPLFSFPDYQVLRDSIRAFSGLIAFRIQFMTVADTGGVRSQRASAAGSVLQKLGLFSPETGRSEFASVSVVSENYFSVLGVRVLRGRSFDALRPRELVNAPSVLISENYWEQRFAGDPHVLGTTMRLNRTAVTVIGVTPRNFIGTGIAVPDFWVPLNIEPLIHADAGWLRDRESRRYRLFARLAPGVDKRQAQAEMTVVADRLRALHDAHSESAKAAAALVWPGSPFPLPLREYRGLTLTILLVMCAAATVLAVACANAGSLQLARARSRENELQTRLSLGASRLRVAQQLLTESALLGLLAGAVALPFTWALLELCASVAAGVIPPD